MARDDRLKKAQAAGADFIETARVKAEEFLKELARSGGETQSALDDLVAGGRRTGEQLVATITTEIRNQINALGLVTKIDLQALEARLTRRSQAKPSAAKAASAAAKAASSASSATTTKKATPKKAAAKSAAPKPAAPKKAAPKKAAAKVAAAPASTKKAAGGSKSAATPAKKAPAQKTTKNAAG